MIPNTNLQRQLTEYGFEFDFTTDVHGDSALHAQYIHNMMSIS